MAALNINSLLAHLDDLKFFVIDSKIDVLAINETKIDSSVNDNERYLPGFEVVRKDRSVNGRSGGGVCIYLRSNINYQIRNDLCDDRLECVVIEIIRPHSRPFIVSKWYKPPNSPQDIFRQFESLIEANPEVMWDVWKNLFMEVVDKHAPLQNKRVSNTHSPWITYELTRKIYKRNYMKKIAIQENSATAWERYKQARNEVNNAIKSAKKQYFTHNLEVNKMNPRKTWKLIDDLSSRKYGRVRNITEIKVNNEPISSAAEMAEVFNVFFATIGSNLASEIQPSTSQNSIYNPRTQYFQLNPQALALYAGFGTS